MLSNGCSSTWSVCVGNGNFLGCCPAPCTQLGMVRAGFGCWVCTVLPSLRPPLPPPLPLIPMGVCFLHWGISTLPLSRSSPQGGKLPTSGLLHCHDLLFSLALCPGHCPSCGAIAWQDLQELCRLRRAKPSPRDQAQVPRPLGNGLAKSQLCDLPAWNPLVTAWERKEAIKKVLFAL